MRPEAPHDETTPVMPAPLDPPRVQSAAEVSASDPSSRPPAADRARPPAAPLAPSWRLLLAASAAGVAFAVVGLDGPSDRTRASAVATPEAPVAVTQPERIPAPPPEPPPRAPVQRAGAARAPVRSAPGSPPRGRRQAAPHPTPTLVGPVETARARYVAGDPAGARGALAGVADPAAAALSARLEAITRLLGQGDGWPPPGGAAALARLLELDAAVAGPVESPLAARARGTLADLLTEKGSGLAADGRWEEAAATYQEALARRPAHAGAHAGLGRVEAAAEALYLEGYATEETDTAAARRLYLRAARLAQPDGALARRIAGRLSGPPPR